MQPNFIGFVKDEKQPKKPESPLAWSQKMMFHLTQACKELTELEQTLSKYRRELNEHSS